MSNDEAFKFSEEQRTQILTIALSTQAAQRSLPPEQRETLSQIIERVGFLLSPGSMSISSPLSRVERRYADASGKSKIDEWKHISGTLIHVDHELTSKRALLVLANEPNKNNLLGQEIVRTNSTEWDDIARDLAREAQQHVGNRVLLRVAVEKTDNPKKPKVRVLHDIVYLGPDRKLFDAQGTYMHQQVRWDALGPMNGQFDTSKLATFQPR